MPHSPCTLTRWVTRRTIWTSKGRGREVYGFLSARHYDGYFTIITSSNLHNNLPKHFTDEESKVNKLNNLPNITQLVKVGDVWFQAQSDYTVYAPSCLTMWCRSIQWGSRSKHSPTPSPVVSGTWETVNLPCRGYKDSHVLRSKLGIS